MAPAIEGFAREHALLIDRYRRAKPAWELRFGRRLGGQAVLTVEDDGPGIPLDLVPRIFERFVRDGRDGARGSGLGLSIVRAVADSHAGDVTLEPRQGGGTRFVVRLPAVDTEADGPEELQTSTTTGSTIGRRRSRS